ncbi:MAG TPA: PH domain-containing protein [Acidimicrobiia bacterium]
MAYPTRLLQDGEELSLDLQPHWWFFGKQILTGLPLFILLIVLLAYHSNTAAKYSLYVWYLGFVVFAGWVVIKYLNWRFTHFVLTNRRVVFRTGVLAKHGVEIPLARINNINFNQGIFERMIGTGNLEIESAGKDGQTLFDNIRHPDGVQQEIYKMMEDDERKRASWSSSGATPAVATAAPPNASVPEQIEQLAKLRDQGVITAQEFEAKKSELLKRM